MIIGITGTLGAGKGAVVEFLKQKDFKHYSVRNFLIEEIPEPLHSTDSLYPG